MSLLKNDLNIINLPFFRPTHNICHIKLPLLTYFDEETPIESKLRSNLEIEPKMPSKYSFCVFLYRFVKQHNLLHIYYSFDLIKVVGNTSESYMNVYLCSLKSSLGLKLKKFSCFETLSQKKIHILFVKPPKNSISCDVFLKN